MKGRPPKSTAKHKEEGTYNATKHAKRLTHPIIDLNDALRRKPDYFTEQQSEKWNSTCAMLNRDGMLSDTYLNLVELFCNAWHRWWLSKVEADAGGVVFTTDSGQTKQNPAVAIEKEQMALMLRILQDFGYTPRSAASIKVENKGGQEDDILNFLNDN